MKKLLIAVLTAAICIPAIAQTTEEAPEETWRSGYAIMNAGGWKSLNKGMNMEQACQAMFPYQVGANSEDKQYCYGGARIKDKSKKVAEVAAVYQAKRDLAEFLIYAYAAAKHRHNATEKLSEQTAEDGHKQFSCIDKEKNIRIDFQGGNIADGYKAVYTFTALDVPTPANIPTISFNQAVIRLIEKLDKDIVLFKFQRKVNDMHEIDAIAYCDMQQAINDLRELILDEWTKEGAISLVETGTTR